MKYKSIRINFSKTFEVLKYKSTLIKYENGFKITVTVVTWGFFIITLVEKELDNTLDGQMERLLLSPYTIHDVKSQEHTLNIPREKEPKKT